MRGADALCRARAGDDPDVHDSATRHALPVRSYSKTGRPKRKTGPKSPFLFGWKRFTSANQLDATFLKRPSSVRYPQPLIRRNLAVSDFSDPRLIRKLRTLQRVAATISCCMRHCPCYRCGRQLQCPHRPMTSTSRRHCRGYPCHPGAGALSKSKFTPSSTSFGAGATAATGARAAGAVQAQQQPGRRGSAAQQPVPDKVYQEAAGQDSDRQEKLIPMFSSRLAALEGS